MDLSVFSTCGNMPDSSLGLSEESAQYLLFVVSMEMRGILNQSRVAVRCLRSDEQVTLTSWKRWK
jgi:hypothetical protein